MIAKDLRKLQTTILNIFNCFRIFLNKAYSTFSYAAINNCNSNDEEVKNKISPVLSRNRDAIQLIVQ